MNSGNSGGSCCIYKNCKNTFQKCRGSGVKFFRVPKDETMCKKWIQASGREDLLGRSEVISMDKFHNYRVCSDHFGNEMYNNPFERTRLLKLAEPYRFKEPQLMYIESTTTCQSVTSTPSMDSNIVQNDFVTKVENSIAEKFLSIKEESELYCRICLCVTRDSNSHINIFPSYGENSSRQDKIQEMIREIMPDLDLSLTYNPGICTDCESRLINAYDFISLSIQNQKALIDYKCKYGDNVYVNIQDVMKTFDNTLNKRPLTDLTDVPSKKLKTSIPSNDQFEIKCDESDIQHPDITIKEELDYENSNDFIESTEEINNEAITEQSFNRLLNTLADKDNYCNLKYINVSVPSLKKTTTNLSEKSGKEKNTSDEDQTYIEELAELKFNKPVKIIYGNTKAKTSDEVQTYIEELAELKFNKPVEIIYGNTKEKTSDEVHTCIKKLAEMKSNKPVNIIYRNTKDLNNTKFEGTKINTITN